MFRWNHIAAVIMSTAMLFSMMPMGVTAAEPAGAETGVQPEQLETGIADAGEYTGTSERTGFRVVNLSVNGTDPETIETGAAAERAAGEGRDTANGAVTGTDPDAASDGDSGGTGTAGGTGTGGAGGSGTSDTGTAGGSGGSGASGTGAASGAGGTSGSGAGSTVADSDGSGGAGTGNSGTGSAGTDSGAVGDATDPAAEEGAIDESSATGTDSAADASTAEEAASDVALVSIHGIVEQEFVQYCEIDSEEMAGQYFDRDEDGTDADSKRETAAGDGLKGVDKLIYDALREAVAEIAAGRRDTGLVKIPIPAGTPGIKSRYTAEDLGLEYVYSGSLNPDLAEALEKAAPVHYDEIMECLIADSSYEMFPLTGGVEKPAGNVFPFHVSGSGDDLDVYLDDHVEIVLIPADEFADPDSGRYAIDTTRVRVIRVASHAAKKIARSAASVANKTGMIPVTK